MYYQGSYLKFASRDSLCKPNALIETGLDEEGTPLMCDTGYEVYPEVKKCVKQNTFEITYCAHDMDEEDSKCYKCPRGYGNKDFGPCSKCVDNCLSCSGYLHEDCTYCDISYGFIGSGCKKCDVRTETFDLVHNICQKYRQHNWDMNADKDSYGHIQLYYTNLSAFADTKLHVENIFEKYWISSLSSNYYLLRDYKDIPRHRKVTIRMEFLIVDIRNYNNIFISVDGVYIKLINPFEQDKQNSTTGQLWGNLTSDWYLDWTFTTSNLVDHTNPTMQLGVISFFPNLITTFWLRDLQVDFFGCFPACSDCTVDNSPLDCTACEDGYYLSGSECKSCSIQCKTCNLTAENCLSCDNNTFLKLGSCVGKCDLGYFLDTDLECKLCPNTCTQCTSLSNCIYCKKGLYLDTGACLLCSSACETCMENNTKCTSCLDPQLLQDNICVLTCSLGYYRENNLCIKCPHGCLDCNSTKCVSCLPGFKFKGNGCAYPCGIGFFDKDVSNCEACSSKCSICSGNQDNCSKCSSGHYLKGTSCLNCSSPCKTCNSSNCLSCVDQFYFYNDECLEICPDGLFAQNGVCKECSSDCLTCDVDKNNCLSCHPTFFLNDTSCSSNCKNGFFKFNDICCPDQCEECINSNECTICKETFYLYENLCLNCEKNCKVCLESEDNCVTCIENYYLLEKKCVEICPEENYYQNEELKICSNCDPNCRKCNGSTDTSCLSCFKNSVLYKNHCFECGIDSSPFDLLDGNCVDRCGDGKRFDSVTMPDLYSFNSCDDGNQINGDGCSSDCQVEKDFICKDGNPNSKDICREIIIPIVNIEKIDNQHFILKFSEDVSIDGKTLEDAININIPQFNNTDIFSYTLTPSGGTNSKTFKEVEIRLNYKTTFENFLIFFNFDRSLIKDTSDNKLRVMELRSEITYIIPDRVIFEKVTNSTSTIITYSSYGISFFSYFFGNYVSQICLMSFFDFQRLTNHIYINSKTNSDLNYFLFGLNMHNHIYDGYRKKNQTEILTEEDGIVSENSENNNLEGRMLIGMDKDEIITNIKSIASKLENLIKFKQFFISIQYLIFYFASILILISKLFLENNLNKNTKNFKRFFIYFSNRFFINVALLNYQYFLKSSLINVYNFSIDSTSNIILSVFSIIFSLFLLVTPAIMFLILKIDLIYLWHPYYYYKLGFLYGVYKLNRYITKAFFGFYFLKTVIFTFFSMILIDFPTFQTFFIFFFNCLFLGLMIKIKPYINIYLVWYFILKELLEIIILANYFFINIFKEDPPKEFIDKSSFILSYFYLVWIFLIIFEISFIIALKIYYFFVKLKNNKLLKKLNLKKKLAKFFSKEKKDLEKNNSFKNSEDIVLKKKKDSDINSIKEKIPTENSLQIQNSKEKIKIIEPEIKEEEKLFEKVKEEIKKNHIIDSKKGSGVEHVHNIFKNNGKSFIEPKKKKNINIVNINDLEF